MRLARTLSVVWFAMDLLYCSKHASVSPKSPPSGRSALTRNVYPHCGRIILQLRGPRRVMLLLHRESDIEDVKEASPSARELVLKL